ncbi:MAG: hypothetical protein R6U89_01850 [Dehalococcoidia bacterium]
MNKWAVNSLYFMIVFVPYMGLLIYTGMVYPDLPDKLNNDLPKALIWLPAFIATILPITYGAMIMFFSHYLKKVHFITIAVFMDLGLFGLIGAVYLVKTS